MFLFVLLLAIDETKPAPGPDIRVLGELASAFDAISALDASGSFKAVPVRDVARNDIAVDCSGGAPTVEGAERTHATDVLVAWSLEGWRSCTGPISLRQRGDASSSPVLRQTDLQSVQGVLWARSHQVFTDEELAPYLASPVSDDVDATAIQDALNVDEDVQWCFLPVLASAKAHPRPVALRMRIDLDARGQPENYVLISANTASGSDTCVWERMSGKELASGPGTVEVSVLLGSKPPPPQPAARHQPVAPGSELDIFSTYSVGLHVEDRALREDVGRYIDEVRNCAGQTDPGRVTVTVTVTDGRPSEVESDGSDDFSGCITNKVETWRFPTGTDTSFDIRFFVTPPPRLLTDEELLKEEEMARQREMEFRWAKLEEADRRDELEAHLAPLRVAALEEASADWAEVAPLLELERSDEIESVVEAYLDQYGDGVVIRYDGVDQVWQVPEVEEARAYLYGAR